MRGRILMLVVALMGAAAASGHAAPRVAQAGPVAGLATSPGGTTDRLLATVERARREHAQADAARSALVAGYQRELAAIDGLKRQRASWRRDRQLRAALATSLETAQRLQAVTARVRELEARLARDRRALVIAIDAELATVVPAERRQRLASARAAARTGLGGAPRKIVVPDDRLDPLADPEELDQQVAALRDSEAELAREVDELARQASRFQRMSALRQQHERAGDLALRDDDGPRRQQLARSSPTAGEAAPDRGGAGDSPSPEAPPQGDPSPGGPPPTPTTPTPSTPDPSDSGVGLGAAPLVLAEVVDAATLESLRRAERSTDPADKAAAAELARKRVAERLRLLRERRAAIERRAQELRAPRR